ncbi:MAG: hypothetical protein OEQ28_05305 [Acidobacteriota bacterium]|nr:hypothetical protein [Acidobacteriota bacterium]
MSLAKQSSHQLFLGVDGGGTKTQIIVADSRQRIIAETLAGPSNPLRVGVDTAVGNILEAVNSACEAARRSPGDIAAAVVGLAGVRREDLRETIRARLQKHLPECRITVVTDAEIALYGTTRGEPGVVLIAGTGSICFGKDKYGNTATSGGWGPIAGDEGGGTNIAKQALKAIAKALDGRGRPTRLCEVGAEYFRASTAEDLIVAIYAPQMDNKRLAGFAKHVAETAAEGDQIAVEIIAVAGFELGMAAYAVIKKLGLENEAVPIGYVGSIFKAGDLITVPLMKTVHSFAPHAFLQEPKIGPATAAAIMARETPDENSDFG